MFAVGTILRYYPGISIEQASALDDMTRVNTPHYTALVEDRGELLQIKGDNGNRIKYDTVDQWLATLPNSPSLSAILVKEHLAEMIETEHKRKEAKQTTKKKEPKPKKVKWNVPPPKSVIRSTHWARHVYTMIKEANPELLKRDDIRDAYNRLMDSLIAYRSIVMSYAPYPSGKYRTGINYPSLQEFRRGRLFGVVQNTQTTMEQFQVAVDAIYLVYEPLYLLIKDVVVPYMENTIREKNKKHEKEQCEKGLSRVIQNQMCATQRYHQQMASFQKDIDYYTKKLAEL